MVHSVTSAPMSLAEDTDLRMRRYLITMGIRIVCFILAIVFQGWLCWAFVACRHDPALHRGRLGQRGRATLGQSDLGYDKYELPHPELSARQPARCRSCAAIRFVVDPQGTDGPTRENLPTDS